MNRYGGERFKRGLWHFGLGKVVSAISGFFAMVLVVRLLSITEFAQYSVLISLVEIFTAFSALGLSHALLRYVPELYAKHYKVALREFVLNAFLIRTGALLLIVGICYLWAKPLAASIGIGNFVLGLKLYLYVVLLRTTTHFLSQVLESTLHQGYTQLAFTLSAVMRLVGMLYLSQTGNAGLIEVIWVEIWSDLLGLVIILAGLVHVIWRVIADTETPLDDKHWLKNNLQQIIHLAKTGYAQHIIGLPFGSNTNRLAGGYLFNNQMMASFGFAQSFYEYIKRYLPAQLLVGLIRPIVVARFSEKKDFSAAAATCQHVVLINMAIISAIFILLAVGGVPILQWISAGKYGVDALWVLVTLMLVLVLETHRLILEMLVQTVERYAILIPSNFILALSILPAILLFRYLGALGFPLMNALALLFCNAWVKRKLALEGYILKHDMRAIMQLLGLIFILSVVGLTLNTLKLHWVLSTIVVQLLFIVGVWRLFGDIFKAFLADMLGRKTDILER